MIDRGVAAVKLGVKAGCGNLPVEHKLFQPFGKFACGKRILTSLRSPQWTTRAARVNPKDPTKEDIINLYKSLL